MDDAPKNGLTAKSSEALRVSEYRNERVARLFGFRRQITLIVAPRTDWSHRSARFSDH